MRTVACGVCVNPPEVIFLLDACFKLNPSRLDFFVRLQLWAPTIVATFHHSSDGPVGFIIGSGQTFGPCAGLAPHMGHSCRAAPPLSVPQCADSRLSAVRARQTDSMAAGCSWKDATVARDVSIAGRT